MADFQLCLLLFFSYFTVLWVICHTVFYNNKHVKWHHGDLLSLQNKHRRQRQHFFSSLWWLFSCSWDVSLMWSSTSSTKKTIHCLQLCSCTQLCEEKEKETVHTSSCASIIAPHMLSPGVVVNKRLLNQYLDSMTTLENCRIAGGRKQEWFEPLWLGPYALKALRASLQAPESCHDSHYSLSHLMFALDHFLRSVGLTLL